MLILSLKDEQTGQTASVTIPTAHGPALRSAVREHRNELGERANGAYKYEKEEAITRAISAFGALAKIVNETIPEEDPHYVGKRSHTSSAS